MALKMCPGCRQNVAADARRCSACGWELSTFNDISANHTLTVFARLALLSSVISVALVDFKYNVSFIPQIHDLGAIFLIATIGSYLLMKIATFRVRRKVWLAAIGSGMLAASGLYVARVLLQQGELPMISMALSARSDATTRPVDEIPTTQPDVFSALDYQPLTALAGKAFETIRQQPLILRAELNAAGVPRMLEVSTLSDTSRILAARSRIKRLYERLSSYEATIRKAPLDAIAQARTTEVSNDARTRFFATFGPIADQQIKFAIGFVQFERQSLGHVDALMALTQSKAGKYTVRGQTVSFSDPSDQASYNRIRKQIADSASREQQLLRGFQDASDPALRTLAGALEVTQPAPQALPQSAPPSAAKSNPTKRSAEASVAE
jgi:hypothetical protein